MHSSYMSSLKIHYLCTSLNLHYLCVDIQRINNTNYELLNNLYNYETKINPYKPANQLIIYSIC